MNQAQWQAHIIYQVHRRDREEPNQVSQLAQRLADLDLAIAALVGAGFGVEGDDIRAIAANVIEARPGLSIKEEVHGTATTSV